MAQVKGKGAGDALRGSFPAVGSLAPEFTLQRLDGSELKLSEVQDEVLLLCLVNDFEEVADQELIKRLTEGAAALPQLKILLVSAVKPANAESLTKFVAPEGQGGSLLWLCCSDPQCSFAQDYGVATSAGRLPQALLLIDKEGYVVYTERSAEQNRTLDPFLALLCAKSCLNN